MKRTRKKVIGGLEERVHAPSVRCLSSLNLNGQSVMEFSGEYVPTAEKAGAKLTR